MSHHPEPEILVSYAAGSLAEPHALLIATHLSLCPDCRKEVGRFEALGGVMLDDLSPTRVEPDALDRLLERLDEPELPAPPPVPVDPVLPAPLRAYVGRGIEAIAWKWLGWGVEEFQLPIPNTRGYRTRLIRIAAGMEIPTHGHDGDELTLVLEGGFTDRGESYRRGDVAGADPSVDHRPIADADGACLCLIVTEGKLRFSGLLGPLLTYFRG